jgi:hypothetical protein
MIVNSLVQDWDHKKSQIQGTRTEPCRALHFTDKKLIGMRQECRPVFLGAWKISSVCYDAVLWWVGGGLESLLFSMVNM